MAHNRNVIPIDQWMARSTLKFFKRTPPVFAIKGTLNLASIVVVKVMAKNFEVVSRNTHFITISARNILADRTSKKIFQEDEIFKAETAINDQLERLNEYFDRRIQQSELKLKSAGYAMDIALADGDLYETKAATHQVTEYLQILKKADLYLGMLDYLWIAGELSDTPAEALRAKLSNEREVRTQLFAFARLTNRQFETIFRICRGAIAQRRAGGPPPDPTPFEVSQGIPSSKAQPDAGPAAPSDSSPALPEPFALAQRDLADLSQELGG